MLDLNRIMGRMAHNSEVIEALVHDVGDEQARWKPSPEDWSLLEVINHLYDEEREDFRVGLDVLLHQPDQPMPGIDPEGWVTARRYNERDLATSLAGFLTERQQSLAWLKGLGEPDWQAGRDHPWTRGRSSAGDMLAAWLAHDFLHIRQLNELHYYYHAQTVAPYQVGYAGTWSGED